MSNDFSNTMDDLKGQGEDLGDQATGSVNGSRDKLAEARQKAATAVDDLIATASHTAEQAWRRAEHAIQDVHPDDVKREAKDALHKAEEKAEALPDRAYLGAFAGSFGLSALLFILGRTQMGIFMALWPPTVIAMTWLMKERKPSPGMDQHRPSAGG
jgi:hypothetical protein